MSAGAKTHIANTLLRSLGGRTVLLRTPQPAIQGDAGEQLGLTTPTFQDSELAPAVFRKVRAKVTPEAVEYELLVSASAVLALVGTLTYQSATVLFASAAGVLVDGVLLGITSVVTAEAFGEVYLYRIGLRGPVATLI